MTDTNTTTDIPTWHHPHFIAAEPHYGDTLYKFKPFTGGEPEPKIPDHAEAAFWAAREAHPWDSDTGRAVRAAHTAAEREARAANTMWQVARHNRHVTDLMKDIAPLVTAFQDAKRQAVDTYESLHATPDGFWQAKLLTLTEQRDAALEAARKLDQRSRPLVNTTDGLPERVLAELPALTDLEKAAGVDFDNWDPQESYGYGDGPDVQALKRLFAEQDNRIAQVTRLFTGESR